MDDDGTSLLDRGWLGVRFKPGLSPLGHHWEILDEHGKQIGTTKRTYGGTAGKVLGRLVTATGMDSGNQIRADVRADGGTVVASLRSKSSKGGKEPVVEFATADGSLIGRTRRSGQVLHFEEGPGHVEVGTVRLGDQDPWPLLDTGQRQIGVMSRIKAQRAKGGSLTEMIVFPDLYQIDQKAQEFQNTMHLGLGFSKEYWVILDPDVELDAPLRRFAVLSPVLAAYSY